MGNSRRAKGKFPASTDGMGDRNGKARPRSDAAMIEEIMSVGFEVVDVNSPSTIRNVYAELMLLVALALKRDEAAIVGFAEIQQRTRNGNQRRRLIVVAVESAESPVEAGNVYGRAESRADRGLCKSAGEVRRAHAGGERQP